MKFLSLFDGCHMFGLGARRAGFGCAGTSEIDTHAANVTRYHYPNTPQLGDVRDVGATDADLIIGGFPCQDLSVAGDRRGLAGERSGLFWEIVRIARESSPRWLLLENVPGLLSSNGGRDMGAVLGALGELGYGWAYRVLDAQHFGVPQRRRRVFIVGCLGDARRAVEVLFEPESVRGDSAPSREARAGSAGCLVAGVSVGGQISHTLTGEGFDASEDGTGRGTPIVARCLTSHAGRLDGDTETFVVADMAQVTNATNRSSPQPGDPAPTLAATSRMTAFNWRGYAPSDVSPCLDTDGSGSIAMFSLRGREGGDRVEIDDGAVSTLRASQGGGDRPFVSYRSTVRRLMPVECERLQGLPDDWTRYGRREDGTVYELADGPRYKMIGNGGAVPVVEWIARRIIDTGR